MLLNGLLRTLHLYSNTVKVKNIIKTLDTYPRRSSFIIIYYTRKMETQPLMKHEYVK